MKRVLPFLLTPLVASSLAGCATVRSEHLGLGANVATPPSNPTQKAGIGVSYFLPRQLVRITATRSGGDLDAAIQALAEAQTASDAATAKVAATQAAIKSTDDQRVAATNDEARQILRERVEKLRKDLETQKTAAETAADAVKAAKEAVRVASLKKLQSDVEEAKAELARTTAALQAAETAVSDTNTEIAALTAQLGTATTDSQRTWLKTQLTAAQDRLPGETARVARLKNAVQVFTQLVEDATAVRDRAEANVQKPAPARPSARRGQAGQEQTAAASGPGIFKVDVKLEILPPTPDPAQAFVLDPKHNIFRDDDHTLKTTPAGLLTSTDIVAVDHTGDVLVEIARFAGGLSAKSAQLSDGAPYEPDTSCLNSPDTFTGVFDPLDPTAVSRMNADLRCLGVRLTPEGSYWPATARPETDATDWKGRKTFNGIAYRRPLEIQMRVEKCTLRIGNCHPDDRIAWRPAKVVEMALPQAGPIAYVRQSAGVMTKTEYGLKFSDGMLVDYDASRPSEALEIAKTPLKVVDGFFDGVSKVISLRTGQTNKQAEYLEAQKKLLEAEYALKKAPLTGQQGLAAAELELLKAEVALQAGQVDGQKTMTTAELNLLKEQLELLKQQYAAQQLALTNQTTTLGDQQTLLTAQTNLTIAQNNAVAQVLANELANQQAILRAQARREAMTRCIADKQQAGESIESCLPAT